MYLAVIRYPLLLLLLLALLLSPLLAATLPSVSRFTRLDVQHGLSQATVTALAQDHSGNIWIGTQNGLNRYDGFTVTVFRPDRGHSHSISD